jgi:hypothetical protein
MPWEGVPTSVPPGIVGGVAVATKTGWNLVEYSDLVTGQKIRFTAKPVVVALAEVRLGSILPVKGPSITVPTIDIPNPSKIVRVARDDFSSGYYCDLVGSKARDAAKAMAPPWPLNTIWDWTCDIFVYGVFYIAMAGIGFILNVLWDSFVQPQLDRVQDGIDAALSDFHDKVQAAVNSFGSGLETIINNGLSSVIPTLYQMTGLPEGLLMTLVNTTNVTITGFEYYALSVGQRTHYIAMGIP